MLLLFSFPFSPLSASCFHFVHHDFSPHSPIYFCVHLFTYNFFFHSISYVNSLSFLFSILFSLLLIFISYTYFYAHICVHIYMLCLYRFINVYIFVLFLYFHALITHRLILNQLHIQVSVLQKNALEYVEKNLYLYFFL